MKPTVALIHPNAETIRQSCESVAADLYTGQRHDPGWRGLDIVVVHCGVPQWVAAVAELRRNNPGLRVAAIVDNVHAAVDALNVAHTDRLIASDANIPAVVEALAAEPLSDAQRLEREVHTRTAVLQQIKSQWEQSFDAVQDPMAVVDAEFRLVRVNRAYAKHLGRDIRTVAGNICHELRDCSNHTYRRDGDGVCAGCPLRQGQLTDGGRQATIEDNTGLRWVVSAYPVDMPDMPGCHVVLYRDVTRETERLSKIAKADKMSAVGKLAGAVAHELNSPMTSIMVFSEALGRKTEPGSDLHQHAAEVNESARRCRRLIQGLLRFARRPRARERAGVSLVAVLDETRPLLQHRINMAQLNLEIDIPESIPSVRAHVADIEHLLVDLISNAIEACSPGSTIRIAAQQYDKALIELQVVDTGKGMEPRVLEAAFDPFFSTKPAGQAAGLGLTTCEAMVAEMGGSMGLRSAPETGTTAWVRLPVMV